MKLALAAFMLWGLASPAAAQHQHHQTPYTGFQQRTVKALSDEQLADYRAGRGMGLALAGELNGYPGPLHVLELAELLQLTEAQRDAASRLFNEMKAEAVPLGEKLISEESALDREFAEKRISPESLAALTLKIGETQGQLRNVHLKYHLTMAAMLTPHQRHRYAVLRGYQ